MLNENVLSAITSPHLHILQYIQVQTCIPTTQQLHSHLRDFISGVCHVLNTAGAKSNPDTEHNTLFALALMFWLQTMRDVDKDNNRGLRLGPMFWQETIIRC